MLTMSRAKSPTQRYQKLWIERSPNANYYRTRGNDSRGLLMPGFTGSGSRAFR